MTRQPLDYASPTPAGLLTREPFVTPGVWLFLIASVLGSASAQVLNAPGLFCVSGMIEALGIAFIDWAFLRRAFHRRTLTFLRMLLVVGVCIAVPLLSQPSVNECFQWA